VQILCLLDVVAKVSSAEAGGDGQAWYWPNSSQERLAPGRYLPIALSQVHEHANKWTLT
jgi:hypothetical protein